VLELRIAPEPIRILARGEAPGRALQEAREGQEEEIDTLQAFAEVQDDAHVPEYHREHHNSHYELHERIY
jgi:hypothetical protein